VQANEEADEEDRIPEETIITTMRFVLGANHQIYSDGFSFPSSIVLGGQETTAGAMSRLLDLMTLNPSLQTWLREEITEALAVCDRNCS